MSEKEENVEENVEEIVEKKEKEQAYWELFVEVSMELAQIQCYLPWALHHIDELELKLIRLQLDPVLKILSRRAVRSTLRKD